MVHNPDEGQEQDLRVLLEVAASQNEQQLRRIRHVQAALDHPTLETDPTIIWRQADPKALWHIERFLNSRLYGKELKMSSASIKASRTILER